jgi:hypothetical protein
VTLSTSEENSKQFDKVEAMFAAIVAVLKRLQTGGQQLLTGKRKEHVSNDKDTLINDDEEQYMDSTAEMEEEPMLAIMQDQVGNDDHTNSQKITEPTNMRVK